MKLKHAVLGVSLCAFMLGLGQSKCFAEKIAFMDLSLVFDGYEKTKEYDTRLEGVQKEKQKDIDARVDAIKKMEDKVPLLAEKEKQAKQEEVDAKKKDLMEYQRGAELELRKQRDEKLKEILKEIQDVVEAYAKEQGYDFVVNDRVLLYGNKTMDISKEILTRLNEKYKKK